MDGWASTTTLGEIASWLGQLRRVVVLTHVKPDGDAVGATLALVRALNRRAGAPVARAWYAGATPGWLDAIAGDTPRGTLSAGWSPQGPGEEPDGVVVLDTGSWSQLREVGEWLKPRRARVALIDHHRQGDPDVAMRRVVMPESAAVCECVAEVCRRLLAAPSLADLPLAVAEPLYLGIATDTGWFRHANMTARTMLTAAALLDCGVNHARVYRTVEQQYRASRLRLLGRALRSLELSEDGRVATIVLTRADFEAAGADSTDSGGFVDMPLSVGSVVVSVVLTEAMPEPGGTPVTKVSLRSKAIEGYVDVNEVARRLGGGGHMHAAGAAVRAPIEEARRAVLEALG